jgi:serine/threonine-protein kinase HipA
MSATENKLSRILNVKLNDTKVGTLTLLAGDNTLFAFDESYVANVARPTLSLWFKTPMGELKTTEKIRGSATLPPFFSNLLPEGHLRDYLAKKANVKSGREFFLIAALGNDLPGAVRVMSSDDLQDEGTHDQQQRSATEAKVLRFSLAGVQLKFSAVMESTGGLTIPADGIGGGWIVKLPSNSHRHVPEAEFSMLKLAERSGITVPEFKLISTASVSGLPSDINEKFGDSLAVKRFDRGKNDTRIHMEDFAQIFGIYPTEKYENASFDRIGYVILSECGEEDFTEYIRRLVFTVVIGNGDMHLKNWSLLYADGRNPRLSPAYDFVPTTLYMANDDLSLRLGGNREFNQVTEKSFEKLAAKSAASERMVLVTVRETIDRIYQAWHEVRGDLPLTKEMRAALESHMSSLQLKPGTKFSSSLPTLDLLKKDVMYMEQNRLAEIEGAIEFRITGQNYVYNLDKLIATVRRSGETFDEFLTEQIAMNLYKSRPKESLTILYAPFREKLLLTVSGKHNPACNWLSKLPGFEESGRDWAPETAVPFIYWSGDKLYRVYPALGRDPDDDAPDKYYITDLGKWNPPYIQRTDVDTHKHIAELKRDPMYYAVPTSGQRTIAVDGDTAVVYHAFVKYSQ